MKMQLKETNGVVIKKTRWVVIYDGQNYSRTVTENTVDHTYDIDWEILDPVTKEDNKLWDGEILEYEFQRLQELDALKEKLVDLSEQLDDLDFGDDEDEKMKEILSLLPNYNKCHKKWIDDKTLSDDDEIPKTKAEQLVKFLIRNTTRLFSITEVENLINIAVLESTNQTDELDNALEQFTEDYADGAFKGFNRFLKGEKVGPEYSDIPDCVNESINVEVPLYNPEDNPLKNTNNHSLTQIFEELKFGRKASEQRFLSDCIDKLDKGDNIC